MDSYGFSIFQTTAIILISLEYGMKILPQMGGIFCYIEDLNEVTRVFTSWPSSWGQVRAYLGEEKS